MCVFVSVCMRMHPFTASQAQGFTGYMGIKQYALRKNQRMGMHPLPLPTWPVGRSPPCASASSCSYGEAFTI